MSPEEKASASLLTELDPIAPAEGKSTFEGIVPIVQGKSEALQVGRMNGIVPRSLLRFRMPADSLARALGGADAHDLLMLSLRIQLWTDAEGGGRGVPDLRISRPEGFWDETSTFVNGQDPATHADFPISAITPAAVTDNGDGSLTVDLPRVILDGALSADPITPNLEVMLHPASGAEFLTVLSSADASGPRGPRGGAPGLSSCYPWGGGTPIRDRRG